MDSAIDVIVQELFSAVHDLERHTQALQARAGELRASVDRGRDTPIDAAERRRIDRDLRAQREAIDLSTLDEVLSHLRACLEAERHEIERVTRLEKVVSALDAVPAEAVVVRVRR